MPLPASKPCGCNSKPKSVLAAFAILYYLYQLKDQEFLPKFSLALIFGGALGNVAAQAFEQGLLSPAIAPADELAAEVNYQEDPMSSPQAMNDEIVNTQGEGITFNFGAANFISNAGCPIPLRENTAQGIFDRGTQGGRIDTGNFP